MRPIDADTLLQKLAELKTEGGIFTEEEYYAEDVEKLIRNAPTVKIHPKIRTGRWAPSEYQDGTDTKYLECTSCREIIAADDLDYYKFCPNCGADMRPRVRSGEPHKKPKAEEEEE